MTQQMYRDGAALILKYNRDVILLYRDNNPDLLYPNHWSLIGGGIEEDESPIEAAVRECQEEINITPLNVQPLEIADFNGIKIHVFIGHYDSLDGICLNEGQAYGVFQPKATLHLPLAFNAEDLLRRWVIEQ